MKKLIAILITLAMATALCVMPACKSSDVEVTHGGENLALDATITNDDGKTIKELNDGSDSTSYLGNGYATIYINFAGENAFNEVVFKEKGERITSFNLSAYIDGSWQLIYSQEQMLEYHLAYVGQVITSKLKLDVNADAEFNISEIEIYLEPKHNSTVSVSAYLTMGNNLIETLQYSEDFSSYFDVLTDCIIIGSVYTSDNLEISFRTSEEDFASELLYLRKIIGERSVKIRPTIDFTRFTDGSSDAEKTMNYLESNMNTLIANINAFLEKYDLDGVDYDWEYPSTKKQWKCYGKLISATKAVIADKQLSVAAAPWGLEYLSDEFIENTDTFNLMTYDLFDDKGNHSDAYLGGLNSVSYMINAGIPKEKILLGIPTYGRATNKSNHVWPSYGSYAEALGTWGNKLEGYEYNDGGDKKTATVYFSGYGLSKSKTALAITMNLGGVMIFRVKCDAPYSASNSIIHGIGDVIADIG